MKHTMVQTKKAAKISAFSSKNKYMKFYKYEYLTGANLSYKPSAVEQFDYSPLSKFFNKRLKEEEKKKDF